MAERQAIQEQGQVCGGAEALSRLPEGALPQALADFWLRQWQSCAATRDRAPVLVDTLDILATLN